MAATYRSASTSSWRRPTSGRGRGQPSVRMAASADRTATKLTALIRKAAADPQRATTSPASAGPTTRAPLKAAELSAIALVRWARSTSSATYD